jgi:hypothetical protein
MTQLRSPPRSGSRTQAPGRLLWPLEHLRLPWWDDARPSTGAEDAGMASAAAAGGMVAVSTLLLAGTVSRGCTARGP